MDNSKRIGVLDLEWDPMSMKIVEVAFCRLVLKNGKYKRMPTKDFLVQKKKASKALTKCCGITTEHLRTQGITREDAISRIYNFLKEVDVIVTWGDEDRNMIKEIFPKEDILNLKQFINLQERLTAPGTKSRQPSLGNTIKQLNIKLEGDLHRAKTDTQALAEITKMYLNGRKELERELFRKQHIEFAKYQINRLETIVGKDVMVDIITGRYLEEVS